MAVKNITHFDIDAEGEHNAIYSSICIVVFYRSSDRPGVAAKRAER